VGGRYVHADEHIDRLHYGDKNEDAVEFALANRRAHEAVDFFSLGSWNRDRDGALQRMACCPSGRPAGGAIVIRTIGFIGAGAAATALADGLKGTPYRIRGIASRRVSASRLAASAGVRRVTPDRLAGSSDLVLVAVPDDAIESVAQTVAWQPDTLVAHISGSRSLDALDAARARGARVGSIHPMQAFAVTQSLAGVTFGIEGDDSVWDDLARLARELGGRPLRLTEAQKAVYHLAGTLTSNFTVALTWAAAALWQRAGLVETKAEALDALLPLLRGTVENLAEAGLPVALTGPVSRGDGGTVARHLDALERWGDGSVENAYRALTEIALEVASARGLDPAAASRVAAVLRDVPLRKAG
jgi:predicted short-subunit dehydrogenase-like oxidoreductase (DUF2520 family)